MTVSDITRRTTKRTLVTAAALVVSASAALLLAVTTPATGTSGGSPEDATEVPTTIPPEGVNINDQVVLTPPQKPDSNTMDEDAALKAGLEHASTGIPPTAVLATVTVPGTIPPAGTDIPFDTIQDVQAWVVTFTSQEPVELAHGAPYSNASASESSVTVTHYNIVLDAHTGEYLVGFYTK
jgi:hypothetical protein